MKTNKHSKIFLVASIFSILFFHSNVNASSKFASNVRTLDDSTIQLSVWSNAYALPADLEQMAFKLAAKATLNHGYDYFSLMHNYVSSEKSNARFSSKSDRSTIVFSKTKNGKPVEDTITQNLNDLSITFERFLVSTIIQFSNVDSDNSAHFVYRAVDVLRGTAYLEDYFDQSENAVASAVQALRSPEKATVINVAVNATPTTPALAVPAEIHVASIEELHQLSNAAFNQQHWKEVIELSSQIIEQDVSNYLAYSNRSGAEAELGNLVDALDDVDMALTLNSDYKNAYHNRGYIHALMNDNPSAITDYKKACSLGIEQSCQEVKSLTTAEVETVVAKVIATEVATKAPTVANLLALTNTAFAERQWSEVIRLSSDIIKVDNVNYLAYSNRSGALAEEGKLDEALDDANKTLELNADYKFAYHNRGYIYSLLDDDSSAIADYKIACGMGVEQSCKEQLSLAMLVEDETEVELASTLPTTSVNDLLALTDKAFASQQWDEVVRLSTEVIAQDANNYLAYSNRSGALAEQGKLKKALQDVNKTLALNAEYKNAYHNRAYIYSLMDNRLSASLDYKKACNLGLSVSCEEVDKLMSLATNSDKRQELTSDSPNPAVVILLTQAERAFNQQQWEEVVRLSSEIIKRDPMNYLAYTKRSSALAKQGFLQAALQDVNESISLNPDHENSYYHRGAIYSQLKDNVNASLSYKLACDMGVRASCEAFSKLSSIAGK